MFFLDRTALEAEDKANKKEYKVYADNPLLVKFWDLEQMRGTPNYTVCGFGNINYTGSPGQPLEMYYCNSSYRTVLVELPNNGGSDATADMTGNVLLMHLDETSGTIVDYSGEGNNGTYNGALYNQPGKINSSIGFDGTNDYVNCGNDASLNIQSAITIEAWIKTTSTADVLLIQKYNSITPWKGFGWRKWPDGTLSFWNGHNQGPPLYWHPNTTQAINDGKWHHIAVTGSGTTGTQYIDGERDSTFTFATIPNHASEVLYIGAYEGRGLWFNGTLDEVAIYNRSLSADEIKGHYTRAVLKPVDSPYCVWAHSFNTTELDNIEYSSRNSSYTKICFSVNNSKIGGIDATDTCYYYFGSEATGAGGYRIRYANGSSGTNVSFADSNVAWSSANDVVNWTQTQFTPDLWYATIKEGDLFQLGVYVENNTGAKYTNFTLYEDEIGDDNWNISDPHIAYYQSASSDKDYDLNGTHSGNMTIHVEMAKDMNGLGTVTHNLTLRHPDGSWYYTINGSFNSSDDSDVDIEFDTRNVLNGRYRMKVTAVADDNPSDVTPFLTPVNFTTDNPTYANETHWWRCGATANASSTPITAAVENATTGETIYVFDGDYENECVNVNKTHLTLQGESVAGVNVAAASGEHVFNVTANYVNISWFSVSGAIDTGKAGFYLNGVEHCDISDNNVSGNYYGIYMNSAGNNTVIGNTAESNTEYGIYLNNSASINTLRENIVARNKDGIYLNNAGSNNITCNWLYYNTRAGFNLTGGSTDNNLSHNNIVENGALNGTIREWQFYNNQINNVTATHNWWGTDNETKINESIYDCTYDNTTGNVTVFPRLDTADPCAPIPELPAVILVGVGLVVLAGYIRIRRRG